MDNNLEDIWKVGTTTPIEGDLVPGGIGIDIHEGKAYSALASGGIFNIGEGDKGEPGESAVVVGTDYIINIIGKPQVVGNIWIAKETDMNAYPPGMIGDGYSSDGLMWVNIGQIRGTTGMAGVQGPKGEQGDEGEQGVEGPSGTTDHLMLTNIGNNTHADIDTHISLYGAHVDWQVAGQEVIDASRYTDTVYDSSIVDAHVASMSNPHSVLYEQLGGTQPAPVAHTHVESDVTDLTHYNDTDADARVQAAIDDVTPTTTSMYSSSKVENLISGSLIYKGLWDASTNSPSLSNAAGTVGWWYEISVTGTQDLGNGSILYEAGGRVTYNGIIWEQAVNAEVTNWGNITGTLSAQTDLQAELDAKATTTITDGHTSQLTAIEGKTDHITVTQAVDLDAMETGITANTSSISTNTGDIADLISGAQAVGQSTLVDITGSEPTWAEGQLYNANGILNFQSKYSDVTLQIGQEQYLEVLNSTGTTIPNGSAVKFAGLNAGTIVVELAQADLFLNARVLGLTTMDIPTGQTGLVTTSGSVSGLDTNTLIPGDVVYLSSTVPGGFTQIAPDIASQIGVVLAANAGAGVIQVKVANIIALPVIYAALNGGGSNLGTITNIYQDITSYIIQDNLAMPSDISAGTVTVPTAGKYRMTTNISLNYNNIGNNKPTLTLGIYDGISVVAEVLVTVTKDSEGFALYPSLLFTAVAGRTYSLQIKCTTNLANVIFDLMTFEVESTMIRGT